MTQWSVVPPIHIEPVASGTNNRSYLVETGRDAYFLKSYRNTPGPERLRFEHQLLAMLNTSCLPFAVPSPLPTKSGDTSVEIECDQGVYRASLFSLIREHAAEYGSEFNAYRCGEALAILDKTLNPVRMAPTISVPKTFGDLSRIHPLIPYPLVAIQQIVADHTLVNRIADVMSVTMEQWQRQTSDWRTQIIHGDFYPTNIMMDSGNVTGIVDFEVAGEGYRAMDFSIGLAALSTKSWDGGCSWPLLESFAKGYLLRTPLTQEELTATPVLLFMRELSSFVHWLGRREQGLTTFADILARAHRVLSLDQWLERNHDQLIHRLSVIQN